MVSISNATNMTELVMGTIRVKNCGGGWGGECYVANLTPGVETVQMFSLDVFIINPLPHMQTLGSSNSE